MAAAAQSRSSRPGCSQAALRPKKTASKAAVETQPAAARIKAWGGPLPSGSVRTVATHHVPSTTNTEYVAQPSINVR